VYDPGFAKERSWDIDLLTGYDYVFVKNMSKDPGSHHYRGIVNPDLIQQVASYNPDAIIIYGWKFDSHWKLMRHFIGKIPIYFRGDSTLLDEPAGVNFKKLGRQILLKWVYKNVDFALSPGLASDAYFKWVGLKSKQIIRVPHAVDNQRFNGEFGGGNNDLEKRAAEWKTALGIPESKTVFLFAGKFEPKKDPLLLINAFKKLLQEYTDIHLIMVGDGILKSEIENALHNIPYQPTTNNGRPTTKIPKPITILPFQNQSLMPIIYRLADVFVLPSKGPGETWGLAINEAMACGRAVLVSNKCVAEADLVEDGVNGLVFKAGDEQDLLAKIETMLKVDLKKWGMASRKKISNFTYHSFLEALLKSNM
jgi:glycosyltransferase involved in cell wall biosynthesis